MIDLIRPGHTVRMERGGALLTVAEQIGAGGAGVVHRADMAGTPFAVKWFRQGPLMEHRREAITALLRRGRPPHSAFVWPIDLVRSDGIAGFGYVMPLLEPRFISLAHVLNRRDQPSFRVLAALGLRLVDAFAVLHSAGLCYRDISFGNLRVDPDTGEIAVIDVDNVGPDGGLALVKGTGTFMAPEVLRDEQRPSTISDLHSLAVLLFYLLMHGHPLEGTRTNDAFGWDHDRPSEGELALRNFGTAPLFAFDPDDPSNRPAPGAVVRQWWSIYPLSLRQAFIQAFIQAFTVGLRDASLHGRVKEGTWRRELTRLHDGLAFCPACGAETCYDPARPDQACWRCQQPLPVPPRLEVPGGKLVLSEGAVLTRHHLFRDRDHDTVCGMVEPYPGRPGRVVLRNMTRQAWTVIPAGEEPKRLEPSMLAAVRPMTIDFGGVSGRLV